MALTGTYKKSLDLKAVLDLQCPRLNPNLDCRVHTFFFQWLSGNPMNQQVFGIKLGSFPFTKYSTVAVAAAVSLHLGVVMLLSIVCLD